VQDLRSDVRDSAVTAVYRHLRSDAAAAASRRDWDECHRLMAMAREIERAYPAATRRARFAVALAGQG
jgi:hypothetical protein